LIEVQAATLTYPNGTEALRPVTLSVAPGEFVSLLGPSGCGKSSLLKLVAGLQRPSAGGIVLQDGAPLSPGDIAFVFQAPTLMPWADVQTNVRLPLDLAGVPRTEAAPRVAEALALVGLSDAARQLPRELSGGMQMRVSIARGLVTRPRLLLMDEPFGALDDITRHKLDADLLALARAQRLTVLFVTHSIHEAVFLSDRVVVMASRPGRVAHVQAIEQAWPRPVDVRTSSAFNDHIRVLQHQLQGAFASDSV
jgi:NitT/TauT family transport system ATP-binding protein